MIRKDRDWHAMVTVLGAIVMIMVNRNMMDRTTADSLLNILGLNRKF